MMKSSKGRHSSMVADTVYNTVNTTKTVNITQNIKIKLVKPEKPQTKKKKSPIKAETLSGDTCTSISKNQSFHSIAETTPKKGDSWDDIFAEIEKPILSVDDAKVINPSSVMSPTVTMKGNKIITNGNVMNMSLDDSVVFNTNESNTVCSSCKGHLLISNNILVCGTCGVENSNHINMLSDTYSIAASTECNVTDGFLSHKMIGPGSYGYQRSMLKTCAQYGTYRKLNTLRTMKKLNINSKKYHIPKNVMQEANDMFAQIKQHGYVFRKDKKIGVLSACVYYACYNNGVAKTPSEVAQIFGIEEKFHSLGDRTLSDLNEKGIITIPTRVSPIVDYISRYTIALNIPEKYKQFLIDLIDTAEKYHIHLVHDSKNNTKCVGAIYMLIDRVPELKKCITKEKIQQECNISPTTVIRNFNILCVYHKKLKNVFKRHGISMRPEWRSA